MSVTSSTWDKYSYRDASFVETFFCRIEPKFESALDFMPEGSHAGVSVLFCLYCPIYVMGEGVRHPGKGPGVLPALTDIDRFGNEAVRALSGEIGVVLRGLGIVRAYADELDTPMSPHVRLKSNMASDFPSLFDGYFNWMD